MSLSSVDSRRVSCLCVVIACNSTIRFHEVFTFRVQLNISCNVVVCWVDIIIHIGLIILREAVSNLVAGALNIWIL